jgi:hypothetical protein
MSFDQPGSQPIVHPSKKTTTINPPTVAAVLAVMAFVARGTPDRDPPWARFLADRSPCFPYEKSKY